MSVRTDKSLRQGLEKRRSRALGKLGGPRRKRTAFSPAVWTSWLPSQQTCLLQTVTPLSQPAGLWLSARASHLRAFVCWAGAVSGRLPGLGQLCSLPRLFSDGSLEAPGPDGLCPKSAWWPCRGRACQEEGPNLSLAYRPKRNTGLECPRGFCGVSRVVRSWWAQDRCQELGNQARGHQFLDLERRVGGLSWSVMKQPQRRPW